MNYCEHQRKHANNGCHKCKAAYMRDYRKRKPDIFKSIDLKKRFGITLIEYNQILAQQNNCCAICKLTTDFIDYRTGKQVALAVDHCHKTDKIRGILCSQCNRALGLFKDSIYNLKNAITYLKDIN